MPTIEELRDMQSLNLPSKVLLTEARIREWVAHYGLNKVYVSFSGGKDSTVLLHIAREMYPDIPACFVDTGLEYPEIKAFVKTFENVDIVRPKKTFKQVICEYGYPMIGKSVASRVWEVRRKANPNSARYKQLHGEFKAKDGSKSQFNYEKYLPLTEADFFISSICCSVMKKSPAHRYSRETGGRMPLTAQMASESRLRTMRWLQKGCNAFDGYQPRSNPMSFWTEQDVLQYIKDNNIKIASVYGDIIETGKDGQTTFEGCGKLCTTGCQRTGCVFCGFGAHLEKGENRFQRLKYTHPKLYDYCINGGEYDIDGFWKPNNKGLGMGHVFDECNKIYGDDFLPY